MAVKEHTIRFDRTVKTNVLRLGDELTYINPALVTQSQTSPRSFFQPTFLPQRLIIGPISCSSNLG